MGTQDIINLIIGLGCAGFGWLLKTVWAAVVELQLSDKNLADKVASIELVVAGEYVRKEEFRDDFKTLSRAIFAKLDKIEDKQDALQCRIDNKADKHLV